MKEKKPTPAEQIAAETFKFLYEAVKADGSPTEGSSVGISLKLNVDGCCLEALMFAIQTMKVSNSLDPGQLACLTQLVRQVADQVPDAIRRDLSGAVTCASRRYEDRQQRRLFYAAMAAPSGN